MTSFTHSVLLFIKFYFFSFNVNISFLQVRPQGGGPNTDVLSAPDYLSTRIVLDGQAYRESSTVSSSATTTYGCATLTGEVTLNVPAGNHVVQLEWKRHGEYFKRKERASRNGKHCS